MASQIASLANVLILLKLPNEMRSNFFRFAVKKNLKIENYSALSKIISFWSKMPPSEDKDKAKIAEMQALCQ